MATPKKLNPLDRVRAKAAFNYKKRLRDQEEVKTFKESLDAGNPFPGQGETYEPSEEKKGK